MESEGGEELSFNEYTNLADLKLLKNNYMAEISTLSSKIKQLRYEIKQLEKETKFPSNAPQNFEIVYEPNLSNLLCFHSSVKQ